MKQRRDRNRRRRPTRRSPTDSRPAAYTLVEMLVALALVLLMMVMFAQIFELAAGAISTQRGMAQNDQKARSATTIIRADLDKRTFRNVIPFFANENSGISPTSFSNRLGYFYISENNPNDDTDDVLQFTVRSTMILKNKDDTPYFGHATLLTAANNIPQFLANPNQPEADDGQVRPDGTANSTAAEISYFLRNGILYRRVLLIREPLPLAGSEAQPSNSAGLNFFDPVNALYPAAADFWNDFDFSAYSTDEDTDADGVLDPGEDLNSNGVLDNIGAQFHAIGDLDNGDPAAAVPALANPGNRFGHNHVDGQPREFIGTDFIGRFTHEETSNQLFKYPQANPAFGNPMDLSSTLTVPNGVVTQFLGGPRRAEDILLTNVHAFNVEVWDERLGQFVDIGHSQSNSVPEPGDFHNARRLNPNYGPSGGNHWVFDTWHPSLGAGNPPPYRPMSYYPGTILPWLPSTPYAVGDVVFPFPVPAGIGPNGFVFAYRCIAAGASGINPPAWPTSDGQPNNPIPGLGLPTWQAVYNLRPLRAIRITIRFLHVSTGQMRQLTLVHSLVD